MSVANAPDPCAMAAAVSSSPSLDMPVKTLKRMATDLGGAIVPGCDKAEVVGLLKKARLAHAGIDWAIDPSDLSVTVHVALAALPHKERVYQIRKNLMNPIHRPEQYERLKKVGKKAFLSSAEHREDREHCEKMLADERMGKSLCAVADAYGGAKPRAVTVRKPVALFTPGALHGEDEGEPELNDLDEEAVLCTLAPGKQLIVDDAGEQVALGADGGEKVVRVKDLLEAIEEVALQAKIKQHVTKGQVDTAHTFCEMYTTKAGIDPCIGMHWGS